MTFKAQMDYGDFLGTFYVEVRAFSEEVAEKIAKQIAKS